MISHTLILTLAVFAALDNPSYSLTPVKRSTRSHTHTVSDPQWSVMMADAMLAKFPEYLTKDTSMDWNYEEGVLLHALWKLWERTGDRKYFSYVKASVDRYITGAGAIKSYDFKRFRLDDITPGRVVLDLYRVTKEARYKSAAALLRKQLKEQPRISVGGFWHKKIYPDQMWLDGLYMAGPFYAKYADMFEEPSDWDDIADQFVIIADHSRDSATGLFYHAWDSSRKQKWANPVTGDSPTFWGRGMGWYMMGLVDVLDYFPKSNPHRNDLLKIFRGLASALLKHQDKGTYLWYQVVDKPGAKGNYLESSASLMFAYAFAKGARHGYLTSKYFDAARDAFRGIVKYMVVTGRDELPSLKNTCGAVGLGGKPYRDGSYAYYVSVPRLTDDFRGVGPFILAALEIEQGLEQ